MAGAPPIRYRSAERERTRGRHDRVAAILVRIGGSVRACVCVYVCVCWVGLGWAALGRSARSVPAKRPNALRDLAWRAHRVQGRLQQRGHVVQHVTQLLQCATTTT